MSKRNLITVLMIAISSFMAVGQNVEPQLYSDLRPDETIFLYATKHEANSFFNRRTNDPVYAQKLTVAGFEIKHDTKCEEMESMAPDGCIKKTSRFARLDVYHPKNPNGQMVLICPGGAYWITATFSEGLYAAQWLTERGITAVVLKYRMPLKVANGAPLEDVHNAMRYCREHASEWGVKSNQIGIMGFSAGGHLAASGSVLYVDAQTRPDFSVLFYPVITFEDNITHNGTRTNLIDKKEYLKEYYSLENQINHNTPPAFILHSSDDNAVPVENSLRYYHNLVKMQVPAEMHIIPVGGHGWGFHDNSFRKDGKGDVIEQYRDVIYSALENFLKLQNK